MYIKIVNKKPVETTLLQLKKENSNVSFPVVINEETLNKFGVYTVVETTQPIVDYTKNITYEIKLVNSKWTKVYSVVDATANEITNRINAEWIVVREKRNQLLRDTDYTQLEDVSLSYADKDKYKQYRKALREITETFSNPFDVVFPIL